MNQGSPGKTVREKPIRVLLFDLDNTLCDLVGAQIAACDAVAEDLDRNDGAELFSYFLSTTHGFESHANIREYLDAHGLSSDGVYERACQIYDREKLQNIVPYAGVRDTLSLLHRAGYLMGVVTDAERKEATERLEKSGVSSFFTCRVTFDIVKKKKPSPEPFLLALSLLRAAPGETLLIGDSPRRDLKPCQELGIRTVYARYGDRFSSGREDLYADYIIDRIDQLPAILAGAAPMMAMVQNGRNDTVKGFAVTGRDPISWE